MNNNSIIINGFHIETNHTLEEWELLYKQDYINGDLWDFPLKDIESQAVEPNPNMVYWLIDNQVYETCIFEDFDNLEDLQKKKKKEVK